MNTILTTTLYYITYPFVLLFSLLLIIAAPLVHLAHYVVYGLWWWPLGVLAKFEVVYHPISSLPLPLALPLPSPPSLKKTPTPPPQQFQTLQYLKKSKAKTKDIQTLYIFFGVATLVGVLAGTSLHFVSGFLFAALSLESSQSSSPLSSSSEQQQQPQRRLRTLAEVREGRRRGQGWDEMGIGTLRRSGKGLNEKGDRDDERVWQERVQGAYRRAEGMQEERAAAAAMAAGRGKGKKKDSYGDWSGRREGERGRKGVMSSTILEEESSSEVGF